LVLTQADSEMRSALIAMPAAIRLIACIRGRRCDLWS